LLYQTVFTTTLHEDLQAYLRASRVKFAKTLIGARNIWNERFIEDTRHTSSTIGFTRSVTS